MSRIVNRRARARERLQNKENQKNIEARVSFGIESIGKRPPITVAPSAD
jgi:hypothetical protein